MSINKSDPKPCDPKCLYARRHKIQKYWPMNKRNVREMNKRIAYMSERFLISPHRTEEIAHLAKESLITFGRPKIDAKEFLKMETEKRHKKPAAI